MTSGIKKDVYLYNTATLKKERFEPFHDPVGMYCCGPTVYNYAHVGNLRTYVFEDILKRTLLSAGHRVNHVVNITDVGHLTSDADTGEDRMEKGAAREGKSVWDIAALYTKKFMENLHDLHVLDPDKWVKATDHIPQMIELVSQLERKGFTYTTSDGIYFDTTKFSAYCDFARIDPESLRAGERVDMGEKRAVTDFALWKFSPTDKQRQMEWGSPWGKGFPGWHIECSAMSLAYLTQPIDIHCGGQDHIRVHHTNEIAQSEAATGKQFVKYWLHGEFLNIDKSKMAKSADNFITLDTLKQQGIDPLAYRMFLFTAHYRSPLSFSWEGVKSSAQGLTNLRKLVPGPGGSSSADNVEKLLGEFYRAVYDDMNMPRAMAAVWDTLRSSSVAPADKREFAKQVDQILALDLLVRIDEAAAQEFETAEGRKIKVYANTQLPDSQKQDIVQKISARYQARSRKDFAEADRIRNELSAAGIIVKDMPDGNAEVRFGA